METTTIVGDDASVTVSDMGSRVTSMCIGGDEILVGRGSDPLLWGCYPMVPWAGRLGGASFDCDGRTIDVEANEGPHAIHGLGVAARWERLDHHVRRLDLSGAWPLGGFATTTVDVGASSIDLRLDLTATFTSFPAVLGWHPCFVTRLNDAPAELDFRAEAMWARGPDGLPSGELVAPSPGPWDDCFDRVDSPVGLSWGSARRIRLEASTTTWVVFDERRDALCVEPQDAPPDAHHLGRATVIGPGETSSLSFSLTW